MHIGELNYSAIKMIPLKTFLQYLEIGNAWGLLHMM